MTPKEIIGREIGSLKRELQWLNKLIFLQQAQIATMLDACAALAASSGGEQGLDEQKKSLLQKVKLSYDKKLLALGDRHPARADELDIRGLVDPEDQDSWFFPE